MNMQKKTSLILDAVIICIVIFPQLFWVVYGINPNNREEGMYLFIIGAVICLPYYFKDGCLIFKFIYQAFMTIGLPRRDWSMILYSVGFICVGILKFFNFSLT